MMKSRSRRREPVPPPARPSPAAKALLDWAKAESWDNQPSQAWLDAINRQAHAWTRLDAVLSR